VDADFSKKSRDENKRVILLLHVFAASKTDFFWKICIYPNIEFLSLGKHPRDFCRSMDVLMVAMALAFIVVIAILAAAMYAQAEEEPLRRRAWR
jgi:hypothetical protein